MLVYNGTKAEFMLDNDEDIIVNKVVQLLKTKMHKTPSAPEKDAFRNSLLYMYKVLNDNEIPEDSGVAIEYNIPQTAKRVDFMISGLDDKSKSNVIIIELKQWSHIEKEDRDALVKTYVAGCNRDVVHPSYQAWSYASFINDFNETVQQDNVGLYPCSYLHNYVRKDNDPLDDEVYKDYLDLAPAFTKGQVLDLRKFIKKYVKTGDNGLTLYRIDNGKIKPSKSLQDSIAKMLKGNDEFTLIDEQKVAFETIKKIAIASKDKLKKTVMIVKGGPGTGKTVVAIRLLSALTNKDMVVHYVTKNSAPREVFKQKLKGSMKVSSVDNLFKGSGCYIDVEDNYNAFHCLLVDEAHRLNQKSGMFANLGEDQTKEIINASKCSVFFIDEHQKVTAKDYGSIDRIKEWAKYYDADIVELELASQFRCNGSDGYLALLDNVLGIKDTANYNLEGLDYDIRVLDTPNEVRDLIFEKNQVNNKSRMVAGYCWDWIKGGKTLTTVHDIVIDDFEMSWNLGNTSTFAIDETSVNECGCIHTVQGLEFDYVGVIIGDDLRYEHGKVITDYTKRAKTDQSLKGLKTLANKGNQEALKECDEIIRNTYRTLMTRGMKGCYVYCTDKKLRDYLRKRFK